MRFRRKLLHIKLRPGQDLEIGTIFKRYHLHAQLEVEAALDDHFTKVQAELVAGLGKEFMGLGAIVDDTTVSASYDSIRRSSYNKSPRWMDIKEQEAML